MMMMFGADKELAKRVRKNRLDGWSRDNQTNASKYQFRAHTINRLTRRLHISLLLLSSPQKFITRVPVEEPMSDFLV